MARNGEIAAVLYPMPAIRRAATALYGKGATLALEEIIEDTIAIDALAGALDKHIQSSVTSDGRLDLREVAAKLIRDMKDNQK